MQLRTLNKIFAEKYVHLELVHGEGYYYFVYDNGGDLYETKSEMVYRLNHLTKEQWLERAETFMEEVEKVRENLK